MAGLFYDKKEQKYIRWHFAILAILAILVIAIVFIVIVIFNINCPNCSKCPVITCSMLNCPKIAFFSSPEDDMAEIKPLNLKAEPFNNDLPNPAVNLTTSMNVNDMNTSNNDYSDVIAAQALEKSVFTQHKAYVNEKNKVTNTASRNPTRSDSQDLIPFVGLRRPQYQVAGKDMVDSTARQVPSVIDADQLAKPNNLRWD